MQQLIIKQLSLIVQKLLKEFDISDSDYKIRLQENKDKEHGDYASNDAIWFVVSFPLALFQKWKMPGIP